MDGRGEAGRRDRGARRAWAAPVTLAASLLLAACTPPGPVDPAEAALRCEQRARAAQGPTGAVSIGVSSSEGPRAGASVGLSSDYLRGRDPVEVYEECVYRATGQAPIRPPRLR